MTLEQQNIAIHESLGFSLGPLIRTLGGVVAHATVPNYTGDLNAMREAVSTLRSKEMNNFASHLWLMTSLPLSAVRERIDYADLSYLIKVCLTPSAVAEAFLRTKGLWK